jgi:hypothetical protein
VTEGADQRLTDLFVRYWDDALSPAEYGELAARLAADPVARAELRLFSVQAVAAAEAGRVRLAVPRRRWSRRQLLGLAGGGVAAGLAAALVGRPHWWGGSADPVRLTAAAGDVRLRTPAGEAAAASGVVPADTVVSTIGPNSSAVLRFPDGSDVSVAGESAVSVGEQGRNLRLLRGTATATVAAPGPGAESITLTTTEATCSRLGGAVLTLTRSLRATEIAVKTGRAAVADAAGDLVEVVHSGEYLTIRADGKHRKQPVEPVAEECRWDLTRPLPEGWGVGRIDTSEGGPPALAPVLWFDPYHHAHMYQIRSDHRWHKGFARLHPDSRFVVRYRVDRRGPGQLVAVVRKDDVAAPDTGVVEWNGTFREARPGQWNVLEVRAGDMLDNKHAPGFAAPWVAFLIIFNSYKEDLGLRVADFRVVPPGPAA